MHAAAGALRVRSPVPRGGARAGRRALLGRSKPVVRGVRTLQPNEERARPVPLPASRVPTAVGGVELVVCDDAEAAARTAAERLADAARRGSSVALCGGSTPRRAYELAGDLEPDWSRAELWWGDERCVPPEDERSNFRLARESLLERIARPPAAIHRIEAERGGAAAAAAYARELDGVELDFVLLGIGPDGHTASLFPHAPALDERERRVTAVEPGLEPWVERVTLTLLPLNAARHVVFLVVGAEKATAVRAAFIEAPSPRTPASLVRGSRTTAIVDREAAASLPASLLS